MTSELTATTNTESSSTPILIKAYGEFWSPEVVNWENKYRLLGKRRSDSNGQDINVYEERGVYVLYQDFVPVYVGRADKQSIGWRLQAHRDSRRKGPRWDRFSWFGTRSIRKNGKLGNLNAAAHSPTTELIATLEALLIMVIDPRLNARRERFKNAIILYQSDTDKPKEIDERLVEVDVRLQSIEKKLDLVLQPEPPSKPRAPRKSKGWVRVG